MRKTSQLLFLIYIQCLLVSCTNTQAKVLNFVNNYNQYAPKMANYMINRTYAETITHESTDDIKIVFVLNIKEDDPNVENYGKLFPVLISGVLKEEKESYELLKEGVKFQVVFSDIDNNVLKKLTIDQQTVEEMTKNTTADQVDHGNGLPPELNKLIAVLNSNLPVENKEEGTKTLKIEVNDKKALIYKIEVSKEVQVIFKSPDHLGLLKNNIKQHPTFKNMVNLLRKYEITAVKYNYVDLKGNLLSEITIPRNEFGYLTQ